MQLQVSRTVQCLRACVNQENQTMSTFDMAEVGTIKLEEVANYTPSEGLPKFTLSVQSPDGKSGLWKSNSVIINY